MIPRLILIVLMLASSACVLTPEQRANALEAADRACLISKALRDGDLVTEEQRVGLERARGLALLARLAAGLPADCDNDEPTE